MNQHSLKTLAILRNEAAHCRSCDLFRNATQVVFGEGVRDASIVLIGEQPGNEEDLEGRPFVGPSGRLLDRALQEAGLDRSAIYITNAVKHFKFEERGKRRIHKKPSSAEVAACRPWLQAEVALIQPKILACLGATAAQSVFGPSYRVTKQRGEFIHHPWAPLATSTIHPAAILRAPDAAQRQDEYRRFVSDLAKIRAKAAGN